MSNHRPENMNEPTQPPTDAPTPETDELESVLCERYAEARQIHGDSARIEAAMDAWEKMTAKASKHERERDQARAIAAELREALAEVIRLSKTDYIPDEILREKLAEDSDPEIAALLKSRAALERAKQIGGGE